MSFDQFSQFLISMSGPTNPIPTCMPTVHTLPVDRYSTHVTKEAVRKPHPPCVMSQVDSVARKVSGQSARMICERSWLPVPVGHVLVPPLWHLMVHCGSVLQVQAAKGLSRRFLHGSEQIRGQSNNSNEAGGKLSQDDSKTLQLNGQSAPTVCERSRVLVPVGPCAFFSPFLSFVLYIMYCYTISRGL